MLDGSKVVDGRAVEVPTYDISDDVRTLVVEWDSQGIRFKPFRTAVSESCEHSLEDSELVGGQTAMHMVKRMLNHGGDPKLWMQGFAKEVGISSRDRTWHELSTLVQVIYLAATFDALNLGALASVEMVARRIAAIAEAHRGGANAVPRWEATRHIVGVTDPYDLVSAELRGHVARAT